MIFRNPSCIMESLMTVLDVIIEDYSCVYYACPKLIKLLLTALKIA